MELARVYTTHLTPTAPFNFNATFHKPDHFTSGDNIWEPDTRWQTWCWQGRQVGLKITNRGSVDAPAVRIDVYDEPAAPSSDFLASLIKELRYRFNLDLDLSGFYTACGHNAMLGPVIDRWRGMRPGHPSSLYEYLIIGVVLQNATVRRSIQMFQALLEHYGVLLSYDAQQLWCFWPPGGLQSVTEEELRALKVGYRAKSIKRIDEAFAAGQVNELELRDQGIEVQRKDLLRLYGVGPATVGYLLSDMFHHWDYFDHISPWEQKIYSRLFLGRDPECPAPVEELLAHFEQFGEYRQLAVHYIWEDLWWKRRNEHIPWLEKLIRV